MLPLDYQLDRAGQHVIRARIFYDLWIYFEGQETQSGIFEAMDRYSEFFRFTPHAFLATFIIYISGLLEKRRDTINLRRISQRMKSENLISTELANEIVVTLNETEPLTMKVRKLRNNAFAHRSAIHTYDEVFKIAAVKPDQLRELTEITLVMTNKLCTARELRQIFFNELPTDDATKIMELLKTI
jgi:hypothetical protein